MGRGLLQAHLEAFDKVGAGIVDTRREGYDKQYEYSDAIKGAYGIFFFRHTIYAGIPRATETEAGTV